MLTMPRPFAAFPAPRREFHKRQIAVNHKARQVIPGQVRLLIRRFMFEPTAQHFINQIVMPTFHGGRLNLPNTPRYAISSYKDMPMFMNFENVRRKDAECTKILDQSSTFSLAPPFSLYPSFADFTTILLTTSQIFSIFFSKSAILSPSEPGTIGFAAGSG